jgi:inactivated superfamily I helicase
VLASWKGGEIRVRDWLAAFAVKTAPEQRALAGEQGRVQLLRDLERYALLIEEVEPSRLSEAAADAPELARHWQLSLDRLRAILDRWPKQLAAIGKIDLAARRNRLLRAMADRWARTPLDGFTIGAGITTAAPAVAALLRRVADLPEGLVVLPGLSLASVMPDEEWDALGPDDDERGEESHPQFHLKLLLDRMGIARGEVRLWRAAGRTGLEPAFRWSVIDRWPVHPGFIAAMAETVREGLEQFAPEERDRVLLLFSAHSLPLHIVDRGDPYPQEIGASMQAVLEQLAVTNRYLLAYQSEVGPVRWLGPSTERVIRRPDPGSAFRERRSRGSWRLACKS